MSNERSIAELSNSQKREINDLDLAFCRSNLEADERRLAELEEKIEAHPLRNLQGELESLMEDREEYVRRVIREKVSLDAMTAEFYCSRSQTKPTEK